MGDLETMMLGDVREGRKGASSSNIKHAERKEKEDDRKEEGKEGRWRRKVSRVIQKNGLQRVGGL